MHNMLPPTLVHYKSVLITTEYQGYSAAYRRCSNKTHILNTHLSARTRSVVCHVGSFSLKRRCNPNGLRCNILLLQCGGPWNRFFSTRRSERVPAVCCREPLCSAAPSPSRCSFLFLYSYKCFCSEVLCLTWYACLIHKSARSKQN